MFIDFPLESEVDCICDKGLTSAFMIYIQCYNIYNENV